MSGKYDHMDDDEAFDAILADMAAERGVSPDEMESHLISAAQSWERSQPLWRRAWWRVKDAFDKD